MFVKAEAVLIAGWNFNALSVEVASGFGTGGVPALIAADHGQGQLDLTSWSGLVDDFVGSTSNLVPGDVPGKALTLVNGGFSPDVGSILFRFSTLGMENPYVIFASQRTASGYSTGLWEWSANGSVFTLMEGVNTAIGAPNVITTVDFSTVDELDDASFVTLRYTLLGASISGINRIDNLQIHAVPETSAAVLGALGLLAGCRRRRGRDGER